MSIQSIVMIDGHEGYFASADGHVYILGPQGLTEVKKSYRRDGYVLVNIEKKPYLLHRVIYQAFRGKIKPGYQINHLNSVRHDCALKNLEECTPKQNMEHAKLHGRIRKGQDTGSAKLKDGQVIQILRDLKAGKTQRVIADKYGISQANVSQIKRGKKWQHLTVPPELRSAA